MKMLPPTKMQALSNLGQSVWLDYLHRRMTRSGELQTLIDNGLRGMTSNPTIFEQAIGGSTVYDDDLAELASSPKTDREAFEQLEIQDVREAADLFLRVYKATGGADGFVSLEVSPGLARDTDGSVNEARRLWKAVGRSNVMIKIPGTREGWPAIERCLQEGININITLVFSVEHYQAVAEAYLSALEARLSLGQPIDRVASVASFFVSRVDTEVDRQIQAKGVGPLLLLQGKAAIASAKLAYAMFTEMTRSDRWRALEAKGAQRQRLLWASVGTKNPEYSDVMYVESLIGPDTITTIPPATLTQFEDHGRISNALAGTEGDARRVLDALAAGGIDFVEVNRTLENEGIDKFTRSLDKVLAAIAHKRRARPRARLEAAPISPREN